MTTRMTRLEVQLPAALVDEMEALVVDGWFRDRDTLLAAALRLYLASHNPRAFARLAREDVEWDLRGVN